MGSSVDVETQKRQIADGLADGRLPGTRPVTSRAGFGDGRSCDGCRRPILRGEVAQEHDGD